MFLQFPSSDVRFIKFLQRVDVCTHLLVTREDKEN